MVLIDTHLARATGWLQVARIATTLRHLSRERAGRVRPRRD